MLEAPKCGIRRCEHFLGFQPPENPSIDEDGKFICVAFPDGIPAQIVFGNNLHLEPIEGDNGIIYQKRKP